MNRRYKPLHVVISQVAAVVISADIAICGRPWWRGGSAVWRAQEVTAAIAVRSKDKLCLPNIGRGPYREFLRRRESRETCLCRARETEGSLASCVTASATEQQLRYWLPITGGNIMLIRWHYGDGNETRTEQTRPLEVCVCNTIWVLKTGKGLIIASCRNEVCSALNCRHLWHFTPTSFVCIIRYAHTNIFVEPNLKISCTVISWCKYSIIAE